MLPCPPLLLEVLLCLAWAAVLSRRLSRALKLLETATLALVSLAESTLELPKRRPHLLARVLRADGGPDEGDGDGEGVGAAAVVIIRESSVNVNLAGNFFKVLPQQQLYILNCLPGQFCQECDNENMAMFYKGVVEGFLIRSRGVC